MWLFHLHSTVTYLIIISCLFSKISHASIPHECSHASNNRAQSVLELFDKLVNDGPSFSLLSQLTNIFENRNVRAHHHKNETECQKKLFLGIDDNFRSMDNSIKMLHARSDLKQSLIESRQTLNQVKFVYNALDIYELQKEFDSRREATDQCTLHHPKKSLIALHGQVTTFPSLFLEILEGTRYSQVEFEKMSSIWLKEAGLCVLLMQACDKLLDRNSSLALKSVRLSQANSMLQDIHQMLLNARQNLTENFKFVVVEDISNVLVELASREVSRTQGVEMIYDRLSKKYPFREWAILMFNRVERNEASVHDYESSTDDWFMVNDQYNTVIAHSSDNTVDCSFFQENFRNKSLRDYFANWEDYTDFVYNDYHGHLGNAISKLKEILQVRKLPQTFFFSVIKYQPSLAVKRGTRFHYFEHIRLSRGQDATKTVLIGWC